MLIKCAGCGKEFDAEKRGGFLRTEIDVGGEKTELKVYGCPGCGVLMTEKFGPVTVDRGPALAYTTDALLAIEPPLFSIGITLKARPATPEGVKP